MLQIILVWVTIVEAEVPIDRVLWARGVRGAGSVVFQLLCTDI